VIRVLAARLDRTADSVELLDGESHHLKVRRASDGDPVEAVDGQGGVGLGRLRIRGKQYTVELGEIRTAPRPAPLRLLVGAGDRDRFLWLIEKATELGATAVVPLATERALHVGNRVRDEHRDRLARRTLETLKQCGGAWAPEIEPITPLDRAVAAGSDGIRWLGDPEGIDPPLVDPDQAATIIIGPEGGLTPDEVELCGRAGFIGVRFGSRVLRFETAAVAGLALIASRRRESHG
jgi:16S rRNA (uracil1498-N3)-methyltransferase